MENDVQFDWIQLLNKVSLQCIYLDTVSIPTNIFWVYGISLLAAREGIVDADVAA